MPNSHQACPGGAKAQWPSSVLPEIFSQRLLPLPLIAKDRVGGGGSKTAKRRRGIAFRRVDLANDVIEGLNALYGQGPGAGGPPSEAQQEAHLHILRSLKTLGDELDALRPREAARLLLGTSPLATVVMRARQ